MSGGLYLRLAWGSLRRNRRVYVPYMVMSAVTICLFYDLRMLTAELAKRSATVGGMLSFGTWIIGIFSLIFIFYTNSFITKRRKKEFGICNILGMEKRHIARVIFLENLMSGLIGLAGGLAAGVVISKLLALLLMKLVGYAPDFPLKLDTYAAGVTAGVFCGIFLLTFLKNALSVYRSNPMELLSSSKAGEREPKVRWALTVIGVVSLALGYLMAVRIKDPVTAMLLFFVAVMLVIIGTYCLFTSISIAVLKGLKKNKRYYYKPNHFTVVSGMLYRMKQNAVGLANICILSTMVLVTVSTTVCLYAGVDSMMEDVCPRDVQVYFSASDEQDDAKLADIAEKVIADCGEKAENIVVARYYPDIISSKQQYSTMREVVLAVGNTGEVYGTATDTLPTVYLGMDIAGGVDDREDFCMKFAEAADEDIFNGSVSFERGMYDIAYEYHASVMEIYGSLFFLGIFLGILFLAVTVMIIYYKQVSEGYDDSARFKIMRSVGMSGAEVKRSIRSQVMTVFFLPIAVACIHLAFAFPMLNGILNGLVMADARLFGLCTAATAVIFAAVYAVVYGVTARTYYNIVNQE